MAFRHNIARQCLIIIVGFIYLLLAIKTLIMPITVATEIGRITFSVNAFSELYAIYVGLWLAQALLAFYAAYHIKQAIFGDWLAFFLLAQPIGRCIAMPQWGIPDSTFLIVFGIEVVGGLALLMVRPTLKGTYTL